MGPNSEQERVAQFRDYSFEEIVQALPEKLARIIDLHQVEDMKTYQTPTQLWPPELVDSDPIAINIMTNNTAVYDDATEDTLYNDALLCEYVAQRQHDPSSLELSAAIRARRSVLVSIFLSDLERNLSSC